MAKNFCAETLLFEVLPFKGGYHTLLGRPAYMKFMAILCYAYMKLKMPSPAGSSQSIETSRTHTKLRSPTLSLLKVSSMLLISRMLVPQQSQIPWHLPRKRDPTWKDGRTTPPPPDPSSSSSMANVGAGKGQEAQWCQSTPPSTCETSHNCVVFYHIDFLYSSLCVFVLAQSNSYE